MRAPAIFAVLVVGVLASVSWTDATAAKAPKATPVAAKPRPVAANSRGPVPVLMRAPVLPHAPNTAPRSAGSKSLPAVSGRAGLRSTALQPRAQPLLGGAAGYDARKGAAIGGALMRRKP
jgi:hypothetical protein